MKVYNRFLISLNRKITDDYTNILQSYVDSLNTSAQEWLYRLCYTSKFSKTSIINLLGDISVINYTYILTKGLMNSNNLICYNNINIIKSIADYISKNNLINKNITFANSLISDIIKSQIVLSQQQDEPLYESIINIMSDYYNDKENYIKIINNNSLVILHLPDLVQKNAQLDSILKDLLSARALKNSTVLILDEVEARKNVDSGSTEYLVNILKSIQTTFIYINAIIELLNSYSVNNENPCFYEYAIFNGAIVETNFYEEDLKC